MADFTDIEKKLLDDFKDNRLRSSLEKIREAMEDIWASDAPRIVQNYTDHGIKHSERLFENAVKLLNASDRGPISAKEMYLLFAGIYLHDIGMQCDVMKYPNIKEHAKRLGAKFEVEFHAKSATSYTIDEQKAIRENHNYLAAAWINYAHSTCESVLGNAARTIPDDLVEDLMDICMYHTRLLITNCPIEFTLDPTGRKRLVAALLRFSDELDVDWHRVSIETVKNFSFEPRNSFFWWLHNKTKVIINNKFVTLTIMLHPIDYRKYKTFIYEEFIAQFERKNQPVLNVLVHNHIPIVIYDSKVVEYDHTDEFPPEISDFLNKKWDINT